MSIKDDRDPLITYSPGWVTGGLPSEYNSTTTYTDARGATARITFCGVGISVYGTIGSSNSNKTAPQSEYSLEGTKLLYQPTLTPLSKRNQRFYQSPELARKNHTLVVTNLINGSSWLFLDYFVILTGETTSSSDIIVATAMPNTMTSSGEDPNRNIPIIAGTVAGTVTLFLLIFLVFFWRRRRKLEDERNTTVVQSAWMDASEAHNWTPVSPPFRPNKAAITSIPSTFTSPRVHSKTLQNISLPSTSNHRDALSSVYDSYHLPPPEYKP